MGAGLMVLASTAAVINGLANSNEAPDAPVQTLVQSPPNGTDTTKDLAKTPERAPTVLMVDSEVQPRQESNFSGPQSPADPATELTLQEELKALRSELAELRKDNQAQAGLRERQDRELRRQEAERNGEIAGAVAKGVVCIALGAIADAPCR